ncbi:MAG TPA: pentapeptide repeat-containing protein [Mycobacterium sp.]
MAFIGAAATFWVGLLNYRIQRRSLDLHKDSRAREIELLRSAQSTDRFTRAIEHLGSDIVPVRMGGIYALERMARDIPEDRAYIIDTLAAFVRERQQASNVGRGGYVTTLQVRAPDAQAAVTVLCRSPLADERVSNPTAGSLDLSRTDLRRADLHGARLDGVNLYAARMEGADLRGAHLANSNLDHANLGRFDSGNKLYRHGANLTGADLTGASLNDVDGMDVALVEGVRGFDV